MTRIVGATSVAVGGRGVAGTFAVMLCLAVVLVASPAGWTGAPRVGGLAGKPPATGPLREPSLTPQQVTRGIYTIRIGDGSLPPRLWPGRICRLALGNNYRSPDTRYSSQGPVG